MAGVITGDELKGVRARADMSNRQLANLLGESLSTVNRWLANGVRPEKEAKVRERLAPWLPQTEPDTYSQMSDAALIAEMNRLLGVIGQRLAAREPGAGALPDPQGDASRQADPCNNDPRDGGTAGPPVRKAARGWGGNTTK